MTITANGASPGINGTAATSLAVPYPASMASGDLMRLTVSTNAASPIAASVPAGWTLVAELAANSGANAPSIMVAIKYATGSESGNLTVTTTSAKSWGQITAYRGVDQTTPQDATATTKDQASALTTVDLPTLTTVTDGAVIDYSAAQNGAAVTATAPAGYTELADNTGSGGWSGTTGWATKTTAGATGTVTVTFTASNRGAGILIALRPATTATAVNSGFLMFM